MATKVITGKQSLFSARLFSIISIIVALIPPLLMIWIAASIFVYASIAHHPNPRTVYYNRISGYRFYGAIGSMMIFGQPIYSFAFSSWHGLVAIWAIIVIIVVPFGLWDIIRAGREKWEDLTVEVDNNE